MSKRDMIFNLKTFFTLKYILDFLTGSFIFINPHFNVFSSV